MVRVRYVIVNTLHKGENKMMMIIIIITILILARIT
jgi:hypothetical protein